MSIKHKNIFNNLNLTAFSKQLLDVVKSATEKYWEQETQISFQAINDFREIRQEILIQNFDFFSSQIKVEGHLPVVIRLDKIFIEEFLEASLKSKTKIFKLSSLTPLEVKILNSYCEFLYKKINDILIPPKNLKLSTTSEKNYNILLMLMLKDGQSAHLMLSIPQDRVELKELKKVVSFKDEDFITSATTVRIKAGSSKITLEDLKNLSEDDIVLLEDSDATKLTLISGDLEKKFNVKVNPSLIIELDDEEKESYIENIDNEVTMEKNLWDDIQIEISAEFEKVKMTIGELKQITQGQIVDLGSVFDNEISLYVENKKVARGELIIINDRYAVRLNEVLNNNTKQATTAPKPAAKPQPQPAPKPQQAPPPPKPAAKPQPQPQATNQEEEFDYSDFEK